MTHEHVSASIDDNKTIGSVDLDIASGKVISWLLNEFEDLLTKIREKNPNITNEQFIDKLLVELKASWDPRVRFLWDIINKQIPKHEADQALEVLKNIEAIRTQMKDALLSEENEDFPTWLGVRQWHNLKWSVLHFHDNEKNIIDRLSVQERARLTKIINSLIIWNVALMLWELFPWIDGYITWWYDFMERILWGHISGDHILSLWIISVFGYEATVKIMEVWPKQYFKNNKWDVALNTLASIELWIIWYDLITDAVHPSISWLISAWRAIRLVKPLSQVQAFKWIINDIVEVSPAAIKLSWWYLAFSTMMMLVLTQVGKWHIAELSSIWPALSEMRNLFLWDGFQDLVTKIETHEKMDGISKAVWSVVANTYLISSYLVFPSVMWAIITDRINKWWLRLEQISSLILERVDIGLKTLDDIKKLIQDMRSQ